MIITDYNETFNRQENILFHVLENLETQCNQNNHKTRGN